MNNQNPTSNGFSQTFFNPQPRVSNYHPTSSTMQGNSSLLPLQPTFIEVYQPDYRVHQDQVFERNFNQLDNNHLLDTPIFEESEMSQLFNEFGEKNFEDEKDFNEESLEDEF
eukprot:CAMPEP_0176422070 /NCGR_PEP_ID=MMETSP0127-20121128/9531_1 /TAXON_ID=938130 /ORGANISM="Platyophrya macrostoma, Strain WH" /LENGTH=111 /DNA_ID=CAMNT_0017802883 /DNA_START=168 /DNA_END=503 /DNA_ORIENTATION=-